MKEATLTQKLIAILGAIASGGGIAWLMSLHLHPPPNSVSRFGLACAYLAIACIFGLASNASISYFLPKRRWLEFGVCALVVLLLRVLIFNSPVDSNRADVLGGFFSLFILIRILFFSPFNKSIYWSKR